MAKRQPKDRQKTADTRVEEDLVRFLYLFDAYAAGESALERQRMAAQLLREIKIYAEVAQTLWLPLARRCAPNVKFVILRDSLLQMKLLTANLEASFEDDDAHWAGMHVLRAALEIHVGASIPLIEGIRRAKLPLSNLGRDMRDLDATLRMRWPYHEPCTFYIAMPQGASLFKH